MKKKYIFKSNNRDLATMLIILGIMANIISIVIAILKV